MFLLYSCFAKFDATQILLSAIAEMITHNESDGTISDVCVLLVADEPTQVAVSVLLDVVNSFKSGNVECTLFYTC